MARGPGLRKALAEKFDDELKFFKGWIDKPKAVGSIVPTSSDHRPQDGLDRQSEIRPAGARSRSRHRRHHPRHPAPRA